MLHSETGERGCCILHRQRGDLKPKLPSTLKRPWTSHRHFRNSIPRGRNWSALLRLWRNCRQPAVRTQTPCPSAVVGKFMNAEEHGEVSQRMKMYLAKGAPGCDKFDPGSPEARDLRQLMSVAYEEFHQAHIAYEHTLSIAGDPTPILSCSPLPWDHPRWEPCRA